MDFAPLISPRLCPMDARIFAEEPMNLRDNLLSLPLGERLSYDAAQNLFFLNFEGLVIRSAADIRALRSAIESRLEPIGRKVAGIVNYDNFSITPELLDAYAEMVRALVDRYYIAVSRYRTSTFTKARLSAALEGAHVPPRLYDSPARALEGLNR